MKSISIFQLWLGITSLMIAVVGCTAQSTPTALPATGIRPVSPTVPVVIPTTTYAASPALVQTITPEPTWTALPTLLPNQAQDLIFKLLAENASCSLPCWWGLTPGQTTWSSAYRYLSTFTSEISNYKLSDATRYTVKFDVPTNKFPARLQQDYTVENDRVQMIEVYVARTSNYSVAPFLVAYGEPTEIWIRTYRQSREGDLPFDVVLFYGERGVMVRYDINATESGDRIQACPQFERGIVLALWPPEPKGIFAGIVEKTSVFKVGNWDYRPLQEATGIDVQTFYQAFKDANNTMCIETPAKLWPPPS